MAEEGVLDRYYPDKEATLVICSLMFLSLACVLLLLMLVVAFRPKWRCEVLGICSGLPLPSWLSFPSQGFAESANNTPDHFFIGFNVGDLQAVHLLVSLLEWCSSLSLHRTETIELEMVGGQHDRLFVQ